MRILRDSIDPFSIPTDTPMVGGYVDGIFGPDHALFNQPGWDTNIWNDRFPNAVHVRIAIKPTTNDGNVGDVETGNITPTQAPQWVQMRRQAGVWASIYCNLSTWPSVRQAFQQANVPEPPYWIAYYDPTTSQQIPPGAVAHQWGDPAITGQNYDASIVADYWPGVDRSTIMGTTAGFNLNGTTHIFDLTPAGDILWKRTTGGGGGQIHGDFWNLGGTGGKGGVHDFAAWPDGNQIVIRAKFVDGLADTLVLWPDAPDLNSAVALNWSAYDNVGPFRVPAATTDLIPGPQGPMGPAGPPGAAGADVTPKVVSALQAAITSLNS